MKIYLVGLYDTRNELWKSYWYIRIGFCQVKPSGKPSSQAQVVGTVFFFNFFVSRRPFLIFPDPACGRSCCRLFSYVCSSVSTRLTLSRVQPMQEHVPISNSQSVWTCRHIHANVYVAAHQPRRHAFVASPAETTEFSIALPQVVLNDFLAVIEDVMANYYVSFLVDVVVPFLSMSVGMMKEDWQRQKMF